MRTHRIFIGLPHLIATKPFEVVVDQSGHGHFTKIQKAIDSVPNNNLQWFFIKVKPGIYREKIIIPYDKPYIVIVGGGKRVTRVEWDDHYSPEESPTFSTFADYTVVKRITFVNSYNFPSEGKINKNPRKPAVAALIGGDKSAFYSVGFAGIQDTLWDLDGRHYFHKCTIQGAVDFIFGSGQSIYQFRQDGVQPSALTLLKDAHTSRKTHEIQDPLDWEIIENVTKMSEYLLFSQPLTEGTPPMTEVLFEKINEFVYECTPKTKGRVFGLPDDESFSASSRFYGDSPDLRAQLAQRDAEMDAMKTKLQHLAEEREADRLQREADSLQQEVERESTRKLEADHLALQQRMEEFISRFPPP